jgi:hypothetical protein
VEPSANEMKFALQAALRLRACPPLDLLREESEYAQQHLRSCEGCASLLNEPEDVTDAFREIGERLSGLADWKPRAETQGPSAGEVWTLSSGLSGWDGRGRYYSPPLVLVLSGPVRVGGILRKKQVAKVAQLYDDRVLRSEADDVLLGEEWGDMFAEAWNVYTVVESDLCEQVGEVDMAVLYRVLEICDEDRLAAVAPGSPLYAFRQLELAVGCHTALTSLGYAQAAEADEVDSVMDAIVHRLRQDVWNPIQERVRKLGDGFEARPLIVYGVCSLSAPVVLRVPDIIDSPFEAVSLTPDAAGHSYVTVAVRLRRGISPETLDEVEFVYRSPASSRVYAYMLAWDGKDFTRTITAGLEDLIPEGCGNEDPCPCVLAWQPKE